MKMQIVEKLNKFLSERPLIKEEFEVVYLMVELRKLLDRDRDQEGISNGDSLVRFHADWIVHTDKKHITPIMKQIMQNIETSISIYPKDGNIDFILLPEFRKELIQLLEGYDLPNAFCKNDDKWINFMVALTHIIADQPMINPSDNIAEFRYIDIDKEGLMATIDFKGSRAGGSITLGFGL